MINEIKTYEVNGVIYKTKEEAEKAYKLVVAEKIQSIIEDINLMSEPLWVLKKPSIIKPILKVMDDELIPGYYQSKPQHTALKKALQSVGVKSNSSEGDERRSGYMEIYISEPTHIPSIEEIVDMME